MEENRQKRDIKNKQKAIMDEKATEAYGYNRGLEEGTQRGSKKEKEEIAKKLKQEGIEIEELR